MIGGLKGGALVSKIISYDDAIKLAGGKNCTLLLGNGFSIKYFNYKNLLEKADLPAGDPVRILFDRLGTVDFERVVKTLEDASVVERAYGNDVHSDALVVDANRLREALVHAVRGTHPGHREDIEDVIPNCVKFLTPFENVFTMNYDLLLYWVTLGAKKFNDGFGLGTEENGYLGPFKEGAYCNVYNVHGGLHLFQRPDGDVEKRLMGPSGVIDAIAQAITAGKRFPVYVAEGTSLAKLRKIDSIPYLRYCYETLRASSGPFFIYGHSADPNDAHIYDALFRSNIAHLYFCIHQPSAKIADIDGELARYQKRNGSKIGYTFVDSESVHVWDR
jgi:Domain of unknown function (DUF4917)